MSNPNDIPEDVFTNDVEGARHYEEMRAKGKVPLPPKEPQPRDFFDPFFDPEDMKDRD